MPDGYGYPIGPGAGPGVGIGGVPDENIPFMERLQQGMQSPGIKQAAGGLFAYWLLDRKSVV